jgi:DNA-damage-inducible protein J
MQHSVRINKTAAIHARIEPRTKKNAKSVLKSLGLGPTEAIRMLDRQICLHGGLPFEVRIPNTKKVNTLEKSRRGEDVSKFDTLAEMFENREK